MLAIRSGSERSRRLSPRSCSNSRLTLSDTGRPVAPTTERMVSSDCSSTTSVSSSSIRIFDAAPTSIIGETGPNSRCRPRTSAS